MVRNYHAIPLNLLIAINAVVTPSPAVSAASTKTFTVADEIETARFKLDYQNQAVFYSPDHSRYAALLIRGDVAHDGVWGEIISGRTNSIAESKPEVVARLFTKALGSSEGFGVSFGQGAFLQQGSDYLVWLDNERVAVLWEAPGEQNQLFSVNVKTHALKQLTHDSGEIVSFQGSPHGSIVYDAIVPYSRKRSNELLANGFSVTSTDAMVLLAGVVDGGTAFDFGMLRRVAVTLHGEDVKVHPVKAEDIYFPFSLLQLKGATGPTLFSPDGKQLLITAGVAQIPQDWSVYPDPLAQSLKDHARDPHSLFAQWINQLLIVNVDTGETRPLWSAPGLTFNPIPQIAWSPDGRNILLAPTFFPPDNADVDGLSGYAVAVVDTQAGTYRKLPVTQDDAKRISSVSWRTTTAIDIVLKDGTSLPFIKLDNDEWRKAALWRSIKPEPLSQLVRGVSVEVREGPNDPPVLEARDTTSGRRKVVFDPNPTLSSGFALGRVEFTEWNNSDGRKWIGRLYYPASFVAGQRYPLVIQTHGYAPKTEYSLSGQGGVNGVGLGPTWSAYLAQPLASIGIAVLQIGGPAEQSSTFTRKGEAALIAEYAQALQTAAEHLVQVGLADPARIGLMGHSATGRMVEQALVDSDFPFAAAIAGDYSDDNYLQECLYNWSRDFGISLPFGHELKGWLETSPAFNVERVRTPLQMLLYSASEGNGTFLWPWEMFSRLRHLGKPVELYVIPDIKHGSHLFQNPHQQLALQDRALDWWRFWLQDKEDDSTPMKNQQYAEWRTLREKHLVDLKLPRAPRLVWSSSSK
jgi:hypothetical protein